MGKDAKRDVVRIIYKSGATVDVRCDSFVVTRRGDDITKLEWKNASPRPLHAGLGDIAAVWELVDA